MLLAEFFPFVIVIYSGSRTFVAQLSSSAK